MFENVMQKKESRPTINAGAFLGGLVIGGIVGAGTALLTATRSGDDTRAMLESKGNEVKQQLESAGQDIQHKAEGALADAKDRVESLGKSVENTVNRKADEIEDSAAQFQRNSV